MTKPDVHSACTVACGTTFEFEYLREFEAKFDISLGYESGVHIGLIHEKNERPKISCYCPIKDRMEGSRGRE
jgi:hypothetical protein